jgi:F0F1-type ATP synthase epsilon subunit
MKIAILEAREVVYEGKAKKVILPGNDGDICVLDFHQPFLYRLRRGTIQIDDSISIPIKDGVARMRANELVVMGER